MNDSENRNGSNNRDEVEEKARKIIIEDKRFSRDDEDESEQSIEEACSESNVTTPSSSNEVVNNADDGLRHFEVIDKPENPPSADATGDTLQLDDSIEDEEAFRELTPEDEERLRKAAHAQFEALTKMGIENYLKDIFNVAYILSLQYLGLQPNPSTNLTATDIKRATICIDVIDFLRKRLDEYLSPNDRAQISQLVSELQVVYTKVFTPKAP